jgi:uncharacterized protein YndB with AHSA1/START domain
VTDGPQRPPQRGEATLATVDGRPVLRFERRLDHPPENVWRAVTDPDELAHWFPARIETADPGPAVGTRLRFVFDRVDIPPQDGEIVGYDPPRVYAFRWGGDELRFELTPDGAGCRLVFSQTLGDNPLWIARLATARQAAGWHACLDQLGARLDGRTAATDWFTGYERYTDRFGLAEGEAVRTGDGYLVRFERDLFQPADHVWSALLDGAVATVGERPPPRAVNRYVPAGPVLATDPGRMLAYAWSADGLSADGLSVDGWSPDGLSADGSSPDDSPADGWSPDGSPAGQVRWELAGQGFGCRVLLSQTVPAGLAGLRATVLAAWQTHLELFVAALHGAPRPWPAGRTEELARRYAGRG